jgi:aminocarboxymuconate-semialdehyde decarboxylase
LQAKRSRKPLRIDVHAHCFPAEYIDLLDRYGNSAVGTDFARRFAAGATSAELDSRFQLMDRAGVSRQILSIAPQAPYFHERDRSVAAARLANDAFADLTRRHSRRFSAFGCLPLPHLEASLEEAARCLDELGMAGITVSTWALDRSIADRSFDPLFAELDRRGTVLFVHPAGLACGSGAIADSRLTWPLGAPVEDALVALQMMQSGIPAHFPRLRIILSHLGGFLPFLMRRLDHQARWFLPNDSPLPSQLARRFWYDTVNAHPAALRCAVETLGSDRLLLGSDFPYWTDEAFELAARYISESGLPAEAVSQIESGNAAALFSLI